MKGRNNETKKSGTSPYQKYGKTKVRYSKEYNEWHRSVRGKSPTDGEKGGNA